MYVGWITMLKNYEIFTFLYAGLFKEGLLTIQGRTRSSTVVWP